MNSHTFTTAKEYDGMHGLNLYDYSARFYDPEGVRFTSMDPLAEKYYSWSPYAYVMNNPLKYIDPDGRSGVSVLRLLPKAVRVASNISKAYRISRDVQAGKTFFEALGELSSGSQVSWAAPLTSEKRQKAVEDALIGDLPLDGTTEQITGTESADVVASTTSNAEDISLENKDGNNKPTKNERAALKKEAKEKK